MREVTIGGETHTIVASPLSLYLYKRAFGTDILGDLFNCEAIRSGEFADADFTVALQVVWALIKTAKLHESFPDWEQWVASLPEVDFADMQMIEAVYDECRRGFFRSAATSPE